MTKFITLNRFLELVFKTALGYFVFLISFASVPLAQGFLQNNQTIKKIMNDNRYVVIAETSVVVDVVESKAERTKGLSGRKSLAETAGMFFIFDSVDRHGIWMKQMFFPLDIIWVSENYQVIYIEKNISPNTYPETFMPSRPAKYVLEVNAGFVEKNGIKVGDTVTLF